MNVNKPRIPAEVATLIENMRGVECETESIVRTALGQGSIPAYHEVLSSIPFDTLMAALVNGYERELTDEEIAQRNRERLAAAYREHRDGNGAYTTEDEDEIYAAGIKYAVETLGIQIEGVNA